MNVMDRINHMRNRIRFRTMRADCLFSSPAEERKVLGYIKNLIKSRYIDNRTDFLFLVVCDIFGKDNVLDIIRKNHPEIARDNGLEKSLEPDEFESVYPRDFLNRFLRGEISCLISERIKSLSKKKDRDTEKRLNMLKATFTLSDAETEIACFFYLKVVSQIIADHFNEYNADFSKLSSFMKFGDILLGMKRQVFLDTIANGSLFRAQILENDGHNRIALASWCTDYLSGITRVDLTHEMFVRGNDEVLDVSDYDIPEDGMMVLDTLLRSKGRQNILLYGAPGSGKTSFARSLANKYGKELFTVKSPETDSHKDRLRAVYATVNLANADNSIVLVDEADEIINSSNSFYFGSRTNKSWINQFLDSHNKKVIWITNRSGQIDPSTMRRFSFSMEFRRLSRDNRLKVLRYGLKKKGMENCFTDLELKALCMEYNVDAGGIVNAISTVNTEDETDKLRTMKKIKTVLGSHEKATGGRRGGNCLRREFDSYTLEGLNTSHNLMDIVSSLKSPESRTGKSDISVALLLYGLPGTGKSEFVYYLGDVLGKEVLLKRSSDIKSMWVGETEKNIAEAFEEAGETSGILFFDEADTFLFPRNEAQRSWEISFTNEILTQLESLQGIVVFATNNMDGLDHAALRRFRFKINFRPLTPEGNLHFYNRLLSRLMPEKNLSSAERRAVMGIKNLTPGDFAVVRDQFSFMSSSGISHAMLIEALSNEVRYKKGVMKGIGF